MNSRRLGLLLAVLVCGCRLAADDDLRPAADRVEQFPVTMRDGHQLPTNVYFPKGDPPSPLILVRTPYGLDSVTGMFAYEGQRLLQDGYLIAVQNLRSGAGTDNEYPIFLTDAWGELQDGYDTIEWLAAQEWCDGQIGMFGASGPGITQYLAAGASPPHLKAIHAGIATPNLYAQAVFQGGAFRRSLAGLWLALLGRNAELYGGLFRSHRAYDDFWAQVDLTSRPEATHCAGVHWGGWYDIFNQGTIDAFVALQYHGGEGAKGQQRLIIGPWPHGISGKHGDVEFPRNALLPPHMDVLEFFNHYLKGEGTGVEKWPPVAYYLMGAVGEAGAPGNEWREVQDWPAPATETPFYLRANGALSASPPTQPGRDLFTYDPNDPVPTKGGANLFLPKGAYDQQRKDDQPLEGRPDVLFYTTPPLEEPLAVTGRVLVRLWAASDAPDTDFTAKLTDVYPDGRSILVLDGILRARFREGLDREALLEPGRPYEFAIDLWSTAIVFNKGHRIRIAISSSNYPRFEINPNTGGDWAEGIPVEVAKQAVYREPERPSRLVLPVVDLPAAG